MTPQVKAKVSERARQLGVVARPATPDGPRGARWAKRPGANRDTEILTDAGDADPVRHRGH